jgi:hypothetical protein
LDSSADTGVLAEVPGIEVPDSGLVSVLLQRTIMGLLPEDLTDSGERPMERQCVESEQDLEQRHVESELCLEFRRLENVGIREREHAEYERFVENGCGL